MFDYFESFIVFKNTTSSLITNFDDKNLKLYELVVETYNVKHNQTLLYISNIAKYDDNKTLNNRHSLHCTVRQDISDFWEMFDKLREILNQFKSTKNDL